jgi:hypothetical protein
MKVTLKAKKLLDISRATLLKGDRTTAEEIAVLALKSEDAVDALDQLMPKIETLDQVEFEEVVELSKQQVEELEKEKEKIEHSHPEIADDLARLIRIHSKE